MSGKTTPSYDIADPRPIAADAPYTFFLPGAAEVAAIGLRDLVKLLFEYEHETEKWAAERMWVRIEGSDQERCWGVLENVPDEPSSPLEYGDRVEFARDRALDIVWNSPETAPPSAEHREYWERCLVDDCVVQGNEPVEYLYREQPDMGQEGDRYTDSGWRIRGRQGGASDEDMDSREARYVALGVVLNRDDSWLHLLDAPTGSAFMRNFETGEYVEQ